MLSNLILRSTAAFGGAPFRLSKCTALGSAGAGAVAGSAVLAASSDSSVQGESNNGVVVGKSRKKEVLYKKTAAWEEFYKNAK